jgi:hypothetical protein
MVSGLPDPKRRQLDSGYEYDVIVRRIEQQPAALAQVLDRSGALPVGQDMSLGAQGRLRLDEPFEHRGPDVAGTWETRGRVIGSGPRLARFARVDVVIAPWSTESAQLRVQAHSRFLPRWGERRQRRYFDLAHAAADRLVPILSDR